MQVAARAPRLAQSQYSLRRAAARGDKLLERREGSRWGWVMRGLRNCEIRLIGPRTTLRGNRKPTHTAHPRLAGLPSTTRALTPRCAFPRCMCRMGCTGPGAACSGPRLAKAPPSLIYPRTVCVRAAAPSVARPRAPRTHACRRQRTAGQRALPQADAGLSRATAAAGASDAGAHQWRRRRRTQGSTPKCPAPVAAVCMSGRGMSGERAGRQACTHTPVHTHCHDTRKLAVSLGSGQAVCSRTKKRSRRSTLAQSACCGRRRWQAAARVSEAARPLAGWLAGWLVGLTG